MDWRFLAAALTAEVLDDLTQGGTEPGADAALQLLHRLQNEANSSPSATP
jgi:hypothetical protein